MFHSPPLGPHGTMGGVWRGGDCAIGGYSSRQSRAQFPALAGFLNYRGNQTDQDWGYAVFGKVVEGIEVVDSIAGVETTAFAPHSDVPVEPVVIIKAEKVD